MSCCLVGSRMAESERLSVHGISLQRHSSEVVGNTRRCPEGCCCCVVLYRHSKLLGCYWSPVLGLNNWLYNNNYNTVSSTTNGCGCGFHAILLLYLHWYGAVVVYLLHPGVTVECTGKLQYGLLISSSHSERTCF